MITPEFFKIAKAIVGVAASIAAEKIFVKTFTKYVK